MATSVGDAAAKLKERIDASGAVPIEEAKELVAELEVEPLQRGLVLGYGANARNRWWHRENEILYPGPKDVADGSGAAKPLLDPSTLETPIEQFEAVATQLGVPAKSAKAAAFYLDTNFDLNDPESVAAGLKQVTEITAALKKRLFMTWTSFSVGEITPQTRGFAKQLEASGDAAAAGGDSSNGHHAARRFAALNGEVLPIEENDPGAMSLGEAIAVANTQTKASSNGHGNNDLLTTVLREGGEDRRQALELLSRANEGKTPPEPKDNTELILKLIEAQMETDRERTAAMFQQMATSQEHMVEKLSEGLAQVAQMASQKKGPFDDLDGIFPGLGEKLMNSFLNPPQQDAGGLKITLPGMGANGEDSAEVSLDAYERIKSIQQKDDMLATAKRAIPELLKVGVQLSKAVHMSAEAEKQSGQPEASTETRRPEKVETICVNRACGRLILHTPGARMFQCPPEANGAPYGCGAIQDEEGEWLNDKVMLLETEAREDAQDEARPMPPPVDQVDPEEAAGEQHAETEQEAVPA